MLLRTLPFASVAALLWTTPCFADNLYVAANGTGTACTYDAPCNSLNTAVVSAHVGSAIFCLSTPAKEAIKIEKSLTIDCASARAPVRESKFTVNNVSMAIIINIPPGMSGDPLRTVQLRGLTIDGAYPAGRYYDRGLDIQDAAAVYVQDCVITNVIQQGIYDHRTGGQTKLFVKDTSSAALAGRESSRPLRRRASPSWTM